jgi:thiamine-phosphate pyrophosphorylase
VPPSQPEGLPFEVMLAPEPACHTVFVAAPRHTARLRDARLYFIADIVAMERALPAALRGGADLFQLRDKRASDAELLAAAAHARELCHGAGALLILNDRPDLVASAGADGVHVGQDDLPVAEARALAGADAIVGLSTHTPEQVDAAAGADYIGVGPVHATPTKAGRAPVGLGLVRYAAGHARVPWFAIGGIDPGNLEEVVEAGAKRISVVRAIGEADDAEAAARELKARLEARVGKA